MELIEQIKKMSLRAKELELDKEQIYKKSRVEKELNQKKYIDLLKEVKQIKLRRKLGLEIQWFLLDIKILHNKLGEKMYCKIIITIYESSSWSGHATSRSLVSLAHSSRRKGNVPRLY